MKTYPVKLNDDEMLLVLCALEQKVERAEGERLTKYKALFDRIENIWEEREP